MTSYTIFISLPVKLRYENSLRLTAISQSVNQTVNHPINQSQENKLVQAKYYSRITGKSSRMSVELL